MAALRQCLDGCAFCVCNSAVGDLWCRHLPPHLRTGYHVYESGADVYDCMLNQTNIGGNNNKV